MTIGIAFDNFNQCVSVNWKDKRTKAKTIVSVTCNIRSEILEKEYKAQKAKHTGAI